MVAINLYQNISQSTHTLEAFQNTAAILFPFILQYRELQFKHFQDFQKSCNIQI